jgi:hypothetical protein
LACSFNCKTALVNCSTWVCKISTSDRTGM